MACFEKERPKDRVKSLNRMLCSKDSVLLSIEHAVRMGELLEHHCREWAIGHPTVSESRLVRGMKRCFDSEWDILGSHGPEGSNWKLWPYTRGVIRIQPRRRSAEVAPVPTLVVTGVFSV